MMNKKYQKPKLEEGFYEIKEIDFNYKLKGEDKKIYERFYF